MAAVSTETRDARAAEKLSMLRESLSRFSLDAYLIPSGDEHINEYLPENRKRREWASGFSGSAGDFLITPQEAWVFVDSRYHEQAGYEVATSHIHVSRLGLEGEPTPTEKIRELAAGRENFRLGFDPFTLSVQQHQAFDRTLRGIQLVPVTGNLVDPIWQDAPPHAHAEVFALPESVTGQSCADKLATVRRKLKDAGADVLPVTKLDQVAWLFNLRGQDIPYNPVFMAYAVITAERAVLLCEDSRIQPEAVRALEAAGVEIQPYEHYAPLLKDVSNGKRVLVAVNHTTYGTVQIIDGAGGTVVEAEHPVEMLKAVKNPAEIAGMRKANLRASRGKIRAWYWLETRIQAGHTVTEESFRQAIEGFYAEEDGFFGLSFNTISGAGSNSSIVHYGTPDPQKELKHGELFLIDSGCQFYGPDFAGTTDDTRTMIVGKPDAVQIERFTRVLQAHIDCAAQRFPKGTEGARLDGITRAPLWAAGLDYGHGTGHGVGAFLNVHEGPNGIHKLASKPFQPGMITSIEPGYYEPGWGGIRCENLYLCVEIQPGWYGFETLTHVPFDKRLIDFSRLTAAQTEWLRDYHAAIAERIAPTLDAEAAAWLREMCAV